MYRVYIAFAILLASVAIGGHSLGEQLSSEAIAAFIRGVAKLNEHKKEIFNADTLPALKPILDVEITSNSTGSVSVRIRTAFDTGQVKF